MKPGTTFDDVIERLEWAYGRSTPVTAAAFRDRFDVSRATAYRWAPRLEAARLLFLMRHQANPMPAPSAGFPGREIARAMRVSRSTLCGRPTHRSHP